MIPPYQVSVGQKDADIIARDHRGLQAGVDYVSRLGGGTVNIRPGVYTMGGALHLRSNVRIQGSGENTVLVKNPSIRSDLVEDVDWYDDVAELRDASGFEVGGDIILQGKELHSERMQTYRFTIVRKDGNRLRLDRLADADFWIDREGSAATLFPLLCGLHVRNVEIAELVLDGNLENNEELNGNYGGGVFLEKCEQIHIQGVTSKNYHGDGFSWQVVNDLTITGCRSLNNSNLGLHPGSGSQRPVIRDNVVQGGNIGLYFCWGVKHGLAEGNRITGAATGISIGHRDTDNVVRNSEVIGATKVGLDFRDHKLEARNPHRNLFEGILFRDCSPAEDGRVVDIKGEVHHISFRRNKFEETRTNAGTCAIFVGEQVGEILFEENTFSGFAQDIIDRRPKKS